MPDAQLDDLVLKRLQLGEAVPDQPPYFGPLGAMPGITGPTGLVGRAGLLGYLVEARSNGTHPPVAFLPRRRVKPRAQRGGVPRPARLGGGADEGVAQGIRGGGRLAQHPAAIAVQGRRVRVVRGGQPSWVACRDGRDGLAVVHVHTVVELTARARFVAPDDNPAGSVVRRARG